MGEGQTKGTLMATELQRIEEKLDRMLDEQAKYRADIQQLHGWAVEHRAALFGNGQPGLKADVQKAKIDLDILQRRCLSSEGCRAPSLAKRTAFGVVQTVVATAILAVVGWLLGIFKMH